MERQATTDRVIVGAVILSLALLIALGSLVLARGVERVALAPTPTSATVAGTAPTIAPAPSSAATAAPRVTATATRPSTATPPAPATALSDIPNVRVSRDEYTAHSEVSLAQNPRDPQNLVGASKMFTDNANYVFRIGTYASFDGGQTWIDNGQLPGLEQFGVTSDPTVVFDSAGTAYVEVLAARGESGGSALYLYISRDGGRSWSEPQLVSDAAEGFNDKEWLATDTTGGRYDGALYTAWVQIVKDNYRILFARSTDSGATWSEPQEIAGQERVTRQGPVLSVDGAGNVYLLWANLSSQHFESSVSRDGGVTFERVREGLPFRNLAPLNGNLRRGFMLPSFAADPRTPDAIYLAWDDGRGSDGDVLFSRSTDGGASWSDPVVVNADTSGDQFQPWLAVGPGGALYLQWFDRRDDPANLLVHTYAARSTDGGATWSELRVTDVPSDPTVGLPMAGEVGFYGDYQSLVADSAGIHLFWNETRDGSQQVYTARVSEDRWGAAQPVPTAGPPGRSRPAPQETEEDGD